MFGLEFGALKHLSTWSSGLSDWSWLIFDFVVKSWSLIYGRPLTPSPLPRRGEGTIVRLSKHRRVGVGFARAKLVILFSYKIQRRRCRQTIGRPGGFW